MSDSTPPPPPPSVPPPAGTPASGPPSGPDWDSARKAAKRRLNAKANFYRNIIAWIFLIVVCVVIWAMTGGGYFWPGWVIFGLAVSSFWMGFAAFGPRERHPTEADIEAEMRHQQGV